MYFIKIRKDFTAKSVYHDLKCTEYALVV